MKQAIFFTLVLFSITSISNAYGGQDHSHDNHKAEKSAHGLNLNNGKLWAMDSHTRSMSKKMSSTFINADHSNHKSLNALGLKLQTQLNELIAGCTMEGKAHDQLHTFLTEHIPTIKALSEASNYDSARASAIKLKGQFELYQQYFK